MQKRRLDWWRCYGCGRKVREADAVWLLTGPAGRTVDGTPTRPEPYHPECAERVPLERQWHPKPCGVMPRLDRAGRTVCPRCGEEYTDALTGRMYHP
jgi:hypothetical protein